MSAPADTAVPEQAPAPGPALTWTLSGLLRTGGTAALVIALAQFLLAGVHVDNDLQRFGLMLLQTGLFTGGAFVLQRFLHDTGSARLLLGVSLMSVVAGFAVLGAMLYSAFPLDAVTVPVDRGWPLPLAPSKLDALPTLVQWQAGSAVETLVATVAAALVLLPTARFGFAVLARGSAQRLTALTALACLTLLVPTRDPVLTGLLAAATLLVLIAAQRGTVARDPALATLEGRFARAVPFLPVGVMIVRTLVLHEVDAGFVLPLALAVWFAVRSVLVASSATSRFATPGYALGTVSTAIAAAALSVCLEPALDTASLAVMMLVASLGTLELRRHVAPTQAVRTIDGLALLLAALLLGSASTLGNVLRYSGLWFAVATLPLIGFAACTRRSVLVVLLSCLFGWQSIVAIEHLLDILDDHGWQSLTGVGLVAIAGAGWIERRRAARRGAGVAVSERTPSLRK